MLERVWRKGNPLTLLVGMWVGAATVENSVEVPYKTKNRATIWRSNPIPRLIPWEDNNSKSYTHPSVHFSTIYNIQYVEAPKMSTHRGMDKADVALINNRALFNPGKEWKCAICMHGFYFGVQVQMSAVPCIWPVTLARAVRHWVLVSSSSEGVYPWPRVSCLKNEMR